MSITVDLTTNKGSSVVAVTLKGFACMRCRRLILLGSFGAFNMRI